MQARHSRPLRNALLVALALSAAPGCSVVRAILLYPYDRVRDTLDVVDLGVTVTPKFSFSAYACLLGLGGLGAGKIDGYFVGVGSGRVGIFRHYHYNLGLVLYSYEVTGWGDFDLDDSSTLVRRRRGPVAWLFFRDDGGCSGPT